MAGVRGVESRKAGGSGVPPPVDECGPSVHRSIGPSDQAQPTTPQPTTQKNINSIKAKPGSAWARIGGQPEPPQQAAEAATAPAAEEAAAAIEKVKLEEAPAATEAAEAPSVAAPAAAPVAAAAEQAGEEPVVAGEFDEALVCVFVLGWGCGSEPCCHGPVCLSLACCC